MIFTKFTELCKSSVELFYHPCILHFLVRYLVPPNEIVSNLPWTLERWRLDLCFIIISPVGLGEIVWNFLNGFEMCITCSWDFSLDIWQVWKTRVTVFLDSENSDSVILKKKTQVVARSKVTWQVMLVLSFNLMARVSPLRLKSSPFHSSHLFHSHKAGVGCYESRSLIYIRNKKKVLSSCRSFRVRGSGAPH